MDDKTPSDVPPDFRGILLQSTLADFLAAATRLKRSPGRAAVHGMRVAARRMRAILRALRRDLHPLLYASAHFDLKHVGRSLGPLRETSVRRQAMHSLRCLAMPAPESPDGLRELDGQLASAESELRAKVSTLQRSQAWSSRMARIAAALDPDAMLMAANDSGQATIERARRKSISKLVDQLERGKCTRGALHRLRLATKQARYLCEAIATAGTPPNPDNDVLALLRRLQNALGELNDLFQLVEWLTGSRLEPGIKRDLVRQLDLRLAARQARFQKLRKAALKILKTGAH